MVAKDSEVEKVLTNICEMRITRTNKAQRPGLSVNFERLTAVQHTLALPYSQNIAGLPCFSSNQSVPACGCDPENYVPPMAGLGWIESC